MIRHAVLPALLLSFLLGAAPAAAAERGFSVTGFDRIRVEGPFKVRLTTGVPPYAKASGSAAALDTIAIDVQGRTLVVRPNRSSWGGYPGAEAGPVEIAVGTHDLSAAWVNGSGTLEINRIKGLSFDLTLQGAGSARIGEAAVDQLKIGLSGAASASVAGTAPSLTAVVRGTSSLEAGSLKTKDATLGAEGPSVIAASVSGTAKIDARGAATVTLTGSPACTVRAAGSASVVGCNSARR